MDTDKTQQPPARPVKKPTVFRKAVNRVGRTKACRWVAGTYPWKFAVGLVKDNKFFARFNGITNGAIHVAEALAVLRYSRHIPKLSWLVHLAAIPALPLLAHAAALALAGVLAGVGLCAIGYGFANSWKSLEDLCARTFTKFNPMRKLRLRTQKIVKAVSATPPVRKLHQATDKIAQKPLAQKFLKSRSGRLSRGLTQSQQDVFLALVTTQGAAAAATTFSLLMARHVAGLSAITVGGVLTGGMIGGACLTLSCVWDVFCCTKTLAQLYRAGRNAKKSSVKESAPEPAMSAPPAREASARPIAANATPAFNQAAGAEALAEVPMAAPSRPVFARLGSELVVC